MVVQKNENLIRKYYCFLDFEEMRPGDRQEFHYSGGKLGISGQLVTCIHFNPTNDTYFISGSIDGKVRVWGVLKCFSLAPTKLIGCSAGLVLRQRCRFYDASSESFSSGRSSIFRCQEFKSFSKPLRIIRIGLPGKPYAWQRLHLAPTTQRAWLDHIVSMDESVPLAQSIMCLAEYNVSRAFALIMQYRDYN